MTIDAAFSPGALVGHLSYLLLVVSMLMRRIGPLRVFAIASAVAAISYDVVWLKDPVGAIWESLLVMVNLVQLGLIHWDNKRAKFSPEEEHFVESSFPNLSPAMQRELLNCGIWITGEKGTMLTMEGEKVAHLIYLASGEAVIRSGGREVAVCEPGAFIGEMTVMSGEPANGTAILSRESRYWAAEAEALRKLVREVPEIGHALEVSFSRNMREKLIRANQVLIESGGEVKRKSSDETTTGV